MLVAGLVFNEHSLILAECMILFLLYNLLEQSVFICNFDFHHIGDIVLKYLSKTLITFIYTFIFIVGFQFFCLKLSSFLIFSFFKDNDYDGIYRQYCLTMIMVSYTLIFFYSYFYFNHCPLEWEYFLQDSLVEIAG